MRAKERKRDARSYLRIVLERPMIILAAVVVCVAAGLLVTTNTSPVYESSTVLLVSDRQVAMDVNRSAGDLYQGLLTGERLAKTYSQMITGLSISEGVVQRLSLPDSPSTLSSKTIAAPVKETNLIRLTVRDGNPARAKKIAAETVKVFLGQLASINAEDGGGSRSGTVGLHVVEPPREPTVPVSPKPLANLLISLMIGLAGGAGIALAIDYLDVSVKSSADLESAVEASVLGQIPVGRGDAGPQVITKPSSAVAEAFRTLRTNLQYLNFDRSLKCIAVTSASKGDGKTTVASNLASALAKNESRVILISVDMRRPGIQRLFRIDRESGLSNLLVGEATFDEVLFPLDEKLRVILSGPVPPNPAELLGSEEMRRVVEEARRTADFVVMDCPPLLCVTDSAVIAPLVDGFLLVARAGWTSSDAITDAKEALDKVQARVLGTVLNCFDQSQSFVYRKPNYSQEYYYSETRISTDPNAP